MIDFEALQTGGFSWRSALSLCHASKLAYADAATVTQQATDWGFERVSTFEADDTQGFYAATGNVGVLVFRGTESFGDWISNIQIVTKDRPYGRVHSGFYKAYREVRSRVNDILDGENLIRLYCAGHSLGGALATVAICELNDIDVPNLGGYSYGQPRTGKSDFRNKFNQSHAHSFFRIFNKNDIVPRVPPGYRHVETRKGLTDDGLLEAVGGEEIVLDAEPLDKAEFEALQEGIDSVMARVQAEEEGLESVPMVDETLEGFLPGVKAHDLDLYIERLQELADDEGE